MKKYICLLIVLFLLLAGCDDHSLVRGTIVEYTSEPGIGLVSFVLENHDGKKVGVLLTDETNTISWVDNYTWDHFRSEDIIGVKVMVVHEGRRQMKTGTGETIQAYNAKEIQIESAPMGEYKLTDGTTVVEYESVFYREYYLQNGIKLLRENYTSGPEHLTVQNLESYDNLSKAAQSAVSDYYETMGRLYDLNVWLEYAYKKYLACEEPEKFDSFLIGQEISPTAYNDKLLFFRTVVTLPISNQEITEYHICTVFDKQSGEVIPAEDMFRCDMDTAADMILRACDDFTEKELEDFKAAFVPEMVVFTPDSFELVYMKGSLPDEDGAWVLSAEYTPEVLDILQPWAVPAFREE